MFASNEEKITAMLNDFVLKLLHTHEK